MRYSNNVIITLCFLGLFISVSYSSKDHAAQVQFFGIPNTTLSNLVEGRLDIREGNDGDCKSTIQGSISNIEPGEYVLALFYTISFDQNQTSMFTGCNEDEHLNFTVKVKEEKAVIGGCSPHNLDDTYGSFVAVAKRSWCLNKAYEDFVAYGVVSVATGTDPPERNHTDELIAYLEWDNKTITDPKPPEFKNGNYYSVRNRFEGGECITEPTNETYGLTRQNCSDSYPGQPLKLFISANKVLVGVYSRSPGAIPPALSTNIQQISKSPNSNTDSTTSGSLNSATILTEHTTSTANQITSTSIPLSTSSSEESKTTSPPISSSTKENQIENQSDPPSTPGLIVGIVFASLILTGMIIIMIRRNRIAARKDGFKRMYGDF